MYYSYFDGPTDRLLLAGTLDGLHLIGFSSGNRARGAEPTWERWDEPFRRVKKQLAEYFAGTRTSFNIDLKPRGTTFQLRVWEALQEIPYGETRSYSDVAARIGHSQAVRAVGAANGRNPIPIIIPCHRVIGRDGTLTGFGGGLDTKRHLLELESRRTGLFSGTPVGAATE